MTWTTSRSNVTSTTSSSSVPAAPGLRAAIEARLQGKRTAIISKSLFGKAHTVMAEGGCAAAMGNANPNDNWQRALPRHHARRQVPQQLADGRAARQGGAGPRLGAGDLRRAVRPHPRRQDQPAQLRRAHLPAARPRRRPHRPGADPHAAAEDRVAAAGRLHGDRRLRVATSRSSTRPRSPTCSRPTGEIAGCFGYYRGTGSFVRFDAPAIVLATGGVGKSYSGHVELLGVHRRRPRAGPARRRHADQHGVPAVPPDGHGLAAVGEGDPGHGVGARRRRRAARTPRASGSCSTTSRTCSRSSTRRREEEGDRWYERRGQQPAPAGAAAA